MCYQTENEAHEAILIPFCECSYILLNGVYSNCRIVHIDCQYLCPSFIGIYASALFDIYKPTIQDIVGCYMYILKRF